MLAAGLTGNKDQQRAQSIQQATAPYLPDDHPIAQKDTGAYQPSCERPQNREDAEYCDQRQATEAADAQARWGKVQAVIGVLGIGGILATLVATIRAVRAAEKQAASAKDSADAAHAAIRADNRPWLNFDVRITNGLSWNPNGVNVSFKVYIRNFGPSPAVNVQVIPYSFSNNTLRRNVPEELRRLWTEMSTPRRKEFSTAESVFPTSTIEQSIETSASREQIVADLAAHAEGYGNDSPGARLLSDLKLLVFVRYFMPGSAVVHHTRKAFSLGCKGAMPLEVDVPLEDIRFERVPFCDYAE